METVLTAVKGKYSDSVWIGLRKGTTLTWHWSLADKHFYKEGERNYLVWGQETSNNCGYYKNGKLFSVSCTEWVFSICFDGTKLGREQYVLNTDMMKWTEAQNYCRTHHTDLASVRNAVESQIIQEVAGDSRVWVGLFRDPWTWSDQTYSSLRYWEASKEIYTELSGTTCVALLEKESGRWGERPCDEKHQFLCNCPTVKFFKVRISSQDSSLELNKVQDDILNRINEKLRSAGVTGVTLRWKKYPDERVFIKEPHQGA
ncbi:lectin BRA-3-like [Toxotes jaculatrix]|uniref:lectin BRA-3-like n=1 Tax=Toxotes jaculatrix TaxID=941984 RepID=UPI001B3A7E4F|nr:lectin BRA-3-like [Toxotes jaculatrix]